MGRIPLRVLGAVMLAAAMFASAACGDSGDSKENVVSAKACVGKIVSLGSLSGVGAGGDNARNAAQLAVEQFLSQNPDCQVELVVKGMPATAEEQTSLAQQLAQDSTILGVVGPTNSRDVPNVAPAFAAAGLTMITTTVATNLSSQGWPTFHRIIANNAQYGQAVGRYIANILQKHRVFIIDDTSEYSKEVIAESKKNLTPIAEGIVQPKQTDFSAVISDLLAAQADAVLYAGFVETGLPFMQQLRAAGSTLPLVGGTGINDENFEAATAGKEGIIITMGLAPLDELSGTFVADYRAKFNTEPTRFTPNAFDATNVFLAGIKAGKDTRPAMEAFVDAYQGEGVNGDIEFTPTGELNPDFAIIWAYKAQDGKFIPDQRMYATGN